MSRLAWPRFRALVFALAAAVLILAPLAVPSAMAQTYPDRPIKIVVPFAPGGATDIVARVVGQALGPKLGQAIVVENRPGAAGNIAGDAVAKAAPDGYTLLLGADSLVAINPHLYKKMTFDPRIDLVPVASLMRNQMVLAVNPQVVPAKTLTEFVEFARKAKPSLPYASTPEEFQALIKSDDQKYGKLIKDFGVKVN